MRLRDIAATLGTTERSADAIVTELAAAGYIVKEKGGRRNRYRIQGHLPLPESITRERTIGEVLEVVVDTRLLEGCAREGAPGRTGATKGRPGV